MLDNTLSTNQVKDSTGAEIEFTRLSVSDRKTVFAKVAEVPNLPHRLSISHQEIGVGLKQRRRSVCRIDKTILSTVDGITPVTSSVYIVSDSPIGGLATMAEPTHVLAELMSFCASSGADTTIKFDGTGNGAVALLNGSL